ncbi:hypothetical protein LG3211_3401 [Lysobacter gummosus]|nr:hypothetical protein LG3211_3401 [Lysobacter gummosus]
MARAQVPQGVAGAHAIAPVLRLGKAGNAKQQGRESEETAGCLDPGRGRAAGGAGRERKQERCNRRHP